MSKNIFKTILFKILISLRIKYIRIEHLYHIVETFFPLEKNNFSQAI